MSIHDTEMINTPDRAGNLPSASGAPAGSVLPAGALRELAGEAWREILHCEGPADDDNFFELGGRSLSGAQVLGHLQRHVRTKLSIRVLFDHPVFHEFAAAISRLADES
jgi:hypothetical protein